jgi:hypothetical protein
MRTQPRARKSHISKKQFEHGVQTFCGVFLDNSSTRANRVAEPQIATCQCCRRTLLTVVTKRLTA